MYTPIEVHNNIREILELRPDLRFKDGEWEKYRKNEKHVTYMHGLMKPFQGFCYVATYAFCHLVPEASPYTKDKEHFWAQIDDEIWDLTKEQFDKPYPYHKGRKLPRKSKPTKRVQEILNELAERSVL